MALIQCDFFSEVLGLCTSINVILPQATTRQIGLKGVTRREKKHPVLWLLHGLSDDHTIWLRRTSIERYAAAYGLAVVMPTTHRGFYTDMAQGSRYWTYLSEELPAIARSFFPLSEKREDNFAAGLSMGGYGAFKMALRRPECFAAAASLSGALDVAAYVKMRTYESAEFGRELKRIFGTPAAMDQNGDDLFLLASKLKQSSRRIPKLYQICGTEDYLLPANRKFKDHLLRTGIPLKYEEHPGSHEWGFWDTHIQDVLKWLPIRLKP